MAQRLDETITLVDASAGCCSTPRALARLVADLPKLKAALSTGDAPPISPSSPLPRRDRCGRPHRHDATGPRCSPLAMRAATWRRAGWPWDTMRPARQPRSRRWPPTRILQLVSVPSSSASTTEQLGLLASACCSMTPRPRDLRAATGSELAFAMGRRARVPRIGCSVIYAAARADRDGRYPPDRRDPLCVHHTRCSRCLGRWPRAAPTAARGAAFDREADATLRTSVALRGHRAADRPDCHPRHFTRFARTITRHSRRCPRPCARWPGQSRWRRRRRARTTGPGTTR